MNARRAASAWSYLRRHWLSLRRKRFWAIVLVLVYTLGGFFGVPWLLERTAVETLASDYDRALRIETVRFNPYTFRLEIEDLALDDIDGERLAAFDRFVVDFTLASAVNRAWTFEAIHLDGLDLRGERFASGEMRFLRLVDAFTAAGGTAASAAPGEAPESTEASSEPAEDAAAGGGDASTSGAGPPPVLVEDLQLNAARLRFRDHVPTAPGGDPVVFGIDPVDLRVRNLDTRAGRAGSHTVRLALESGGTLAWNGSVQLNPLRSSGRIELDGVALDRALPYVRQALPIRDLALTLEAALDYTAGLGEAGPELAVSGLDAALRELSVSAFEPQVEFLAADAIRVAGASYAHAPRRLEVPELDIDAPRVEAWRSADGAISLLGLLPDGEAAAGDAEAEEEDAGPPASPLELAVGAFRINGLRADFEDRSVRPAASFGLRSVDVALDGFDLAPGTPVATRVQATLASGGALGFDGRLRVRPAFDLDGELRVEDVELAAAEPYLQQFARVRLAGGRVSLGGALRTGPDEPFAYEGSVAVDGLDVRTATGGEPVLSWQSLGVETLEVGVGAGRAKTSVIEVVEPFARVAIAEDKSTNIGDLLIAGDASASADEGRDAVESTDAEAGGSASGGPASDGTAADGDGSAFAWSVGGLAVEQGRLAFSDRSLPLPFATRVHGMKGRISTLASGTREPAAIELEGEVEENGLARIEGAVNAWDPLGFTDLRLEFRNLEMPSYSPYTVQFAGRRIAEGRMDLNLAYRIDAGELAATNDLVLRELELGDKVESPGAMDLPLGLAVALLKDSDGVIDLAVPVQGNVNDPQFEIGGAIRKALGNLITKIVSSPFRFLASLVGLESGELGRIEFLAGRSDLTPPQRETVDKLAEALGKRPELGLGITGTFAPALDRPVLQRRMALDTVRARLREAGVDPEGVTLTDERAYEAVERLFEAAYPNTDLETVRAEFTRVPEGLSDEEAETAEPVFDEVAYRAHLAKRLVAAQAVGPDALQALADARAGAVRSRLVDDAQGAQIASERVSIAEPEERAVESGERIPLEISLETR